MTFKHTISNGLFNRQQLLSCHNALSSKRWGGGGGGGGGLACGLLTSTLLAKIRLGTNLVSQWRLQIDNSTRITKYRNVRIQESMIHLSIFKIKCRWVVSLSKSCCQTVTVRSTRIARQSYQVSLN